MIAVQPSNLNGADFRPNIIEIIFMRSPLSLSKNKKATTPTNGGAAIGINRSVNKKFFSGNFLYWKIYAKNNPTRQLPATVMTERITELKIEPDSISEYEPAPLEKNDVLSLMRE